MHDQLTLLTNNKDHSYHYSYDPQGDRISIYKNIKDPLDTREWYQSIKDASIEEIREALKKEDSDDVFASLKEEHVYAKDAYKTCLYNEEKDPSDTLYEPTINYILDKSEEHTQVLYENGKLNLYGNERLKSGDTTYLNGRNDTVIHAIRKGKDKQIEYEDFGYSDDLIKGYGYNGEAHDSSGLIYLRARYYNPQIARFIQIDSYEGEAENTQSQNRYSYVVNNPYKFIDPSGHKKKSKKSKTKASKQSTISLGEMAARGGVAIVNTISKTMIGKNIVSQSLTNTIVKAANRLTPTYPVIDYEQRRTSTGFEVTTNYKNGTKQLGAKITVGSGATAGILIYENKPYGKYAYIPDKKPGPSRTNCRVIRQVRPKLNHTIDVGKIVSTACRDVGRWVDEHMDAIINATLFIATVAGIAAIATSATSAFSLAYAIQFGSGSALVLSEKVSQTGMGLSQVTIATGASASGLSAIYGGLASQGKGIDGHNLTGQEREIRVQRASKKFLLGLHSVSTGAYTYVMNYQTYNTINGTKSKQGISEDQSLRPGRTFKSSYDIPVDENGYTKSSLSLGQKVHKEYKVNEIDNNYRFKEYKLPSNKRVDFIDFETKTIYELKPHNPTQIKLGKQQLQGYLEEIESFKGKGWKTVLDTY